MFGQNKPATSLFGSSTPAMTVQPTTTAFGAFGQQQPQPSATLLGQPLTSTNISGVSQPPRQTTSIFGASQQQQPAQPSTSMFGAPQQQQQQPTQQTASIFGASQQQQQPAQPSTNIFGAPQQQQQQPTQQTTSMFGAPQQQQQPAASTSLFGQPAPAAPITTSMFGSTQFATLAQPASTNIFGASMSLPAPAQGPITAFGGFGASTYQTSAPSTSLFGQPVSQQVQQSTTAGAPLFVRLTKFNDLPDDVKKVFEQIDSHIQGRVQISNELRQCKLGDEPQKGLEQIRSVHKDLVNCVNKIRADISAMRELRAQMDQAVQDTIAATRIIDAFKNPQNPQHGVWMKNYANFPLEFFTRVAEQLKERLQWIYNSIELIERKLASEASNVTATPQSITSTIQAQHASFVALASKTAALDAELQKLKNLYRQLWRTRTGSARDPFNEADHGALGGGEFSIEGLNVPA